MLSLSSAAGVGVESSVEWIGAESSVHVCVSVCVSQQVPMCVAAIVAELFGVRV